MKLIILCVMEHGSFRLLSRFKAKVLKIDTFLRNVRQEGTNNTLHFIVSYNK